MNTDNRSWASWRAIHSAMQAPPPDHHCGTRIGHAGRSRLSPVEPEASSVPRVAPPICPSMDREYWKAALREALAVEAAHGKVEGRRRGKALGKDRAKANRCVHAAKAAPSDRSGSAGASS